MTRMNRQMNDTFRRARPEQGRVDRLRQRIKNLP
jgi:hypothetical protein